jgi:hypothetical protein
MPTYSIKAPNGKTYQIDGPAGASDVQVRQQVLAQFPEAAGGSQPRAKTMTADEIAKTGMDAMGAMLSKMNVPSPVKRPSARSAPAKPQGKSRDAFVAGYSKGNLFSLPEYVSTAIGYVVPDKYHPTGNPYGDRGDSSYNPEQHSWTDNFTRRLNTVRDVNEYRMTQSPGAALAGTLTGAVNTGIGVSGGITKAGTALAATKAPAAVNALGRTLVASQTLKKGQTAANLAKLTAGSIASSTAQAAGEGKDIPEAALSPLNLLPGGVYGGAKAVRAGGRYVARPFSGSIGKALREVITENPTALGAKQTALSARTGTPVPLVAALKDRDFKNLADKVLAHSDDSIEIAKGSTAGYLKSFKDRMLDHIKKAGNQADAFNTSVGDLALLRSTNADDMMAPITNKIVSLKPLGLGLDPLDRQSILEIGSRIKALAPGIKEALGRMNPDDLLEVGTSTSDIGKAMRAMDAWGTPNGATIGELDSLRRTLNAAAKTADTTSTSNALTYRSAAEEVANFIKKSLSKEDAAIYEEMLTSYGKHSQMLKGFKLTAGGQKLADIEDVKLQKDLRSNAGRVGMKAGELYRLRKVAGNKTSGAVALARDLSDQGALTRPASMDPMANPPGTVAEHLGEAPAASLADAAGAEYEVLQRMMQAGKLDVADASETLLDSPTTMAYGAALTGSMAQTQIRFAARLFEKLHPEGYSETVAKNLTEMLFSTDPAVSKKALLLLNKAGVMPDEIRSMLAPASIAAGSLGARGSEQPVDPVTDTETPIEGAAPTEETSTNVPAEQGGFAQPGGYPIDGSSPYAADLEQIYSTESPEFLDLIDRQFQQESGHRQFGPDGQPLASSAGAIGVAQVMPGTAPIAAEMAGLPYDEQAYRTDPVYNKMLGMAYMSNMLQRYDGNVALALAAYNAGPGRVDEALSRGDNWFAHLPAETRNYVRAIL